MHITIFRRTVDGLDHITIIVNPLFSQIVTLNLVMATQIVATVHMIRDNGGDIVQFKVKYTTGRQRGNPTTGHAWGSHGANTGERGNHGATTRQPRD